MKRILLLVTVASMLAAAMALSGVAQAKPVADSPDAKCAQLTIQTLGPSFNPSKYTFHGGTEGDDVFTGQATAGPDVFCGFGGDDFIRTLDEGDIFLGGAGNDTVRDNYGTAYGQEGDDQVAFFNFPGSTFNGGAGNDFVYGNLAGSTFNGGDGNERVFVNEGTFNGGAGDDDVDTNASTGTFNGGDGNDIVFNNQGTFNGGPGDDTVGSGNLPVDGP
jgi:Ca2+-binding RTX toxin-like protein